MSGSGGCISRAGSATAWVRWCRSTARTIGGSRTVAPNAPCIVFIDDATGKLLHLRFAGSENTFDYFHPARAYLREWGKPLAFYSDKHGIFRTTHGSEQDPHQRPGAVWPRAL